MAVGKFDHNKAELYEFPIDMWTTVSDYPFSDSLNNFAMVYIPEISSYVVIGGSTDGFIFAQIAFLTNGAWSDGGNLNKQRYVSVFANFSKFQITNQT